MRRHIHDPRYGFRAGKVSDLAGFTSAIILIFVTACILCESVARLLMPVPINYYQAMIVAVLGLIVNLLSAAILHEGTGEHNHDHGHHHDNNFRSAYVHVIADAVTSVAALVALLCGAQFGWRSMDPLVGIVGAVVILSWSWRLVHDTSAVLLDRDTGTGLSDHISHILAEHDVPVIDMHTWGVGHNCHAAVLTLSLHPDVGADDVRQWLSPLDLAHVTFETVR